MKVVAIRVLKHTVRYSKKIMFTVLNETLHLLYKATESIINFLSHMHVFKEFYLAFNVNILYKALSYLLKMLVLICMPI